MTDEEIYNLYVLQSRNVRKLKKVQQVLTKDINFNLKKKDTFQVEAKTKLLALLYCTLSEAQFIQIVHTPKSFLFYEIERIKLERKIKSIAMGWKLMIDIAMDKVGDRTKNADLSRRRDKLHEIITDYIQKPSELRNKVAHGQWDYALNSDNTKENSNTTAEINNLDVVKISRWLKVHDYLGLIIRDLIQSPKKGNHNNYWTNITNLENFITESSSWTIEKRISRLNIKRKKS